MSLMCFFSTSMKSIAAFPGHWELFLALFFHRGKESHSTALQIEARTKERFIPKTVCLSCGSFGARYVAAGNTLPSHTHTNAHTPEVCGAGGAPANQQQACFEEDPTPSPVMSNFRSKEARSRSKDLVWLRLGTVFLLLWLRRLNSVRVSRTEHQVCLGQEWGYSQKRQHFSLIGFSGKFHCVRWELYRVFIDSVYPGFVQFVFD